MVGLRREFSHRELPDGKLPAPAIIVSFGVAAHWSPGNGVTVQQESITGREACGRDIRITLTLRNPSSGPRNWGPDGGDFFQLLHGSRGHSVSIQIDWRFGFARNFWP